VECDLLRYSSLLIVNANDKKSDVFGYFNKAKDEFFARSHTISVNKGPLNTGTGLFGLAGSVARLFGQTTKSCRMLTLTQST